jgi:sulfonate transport system substrate-binding protein
VRRNAVKSSRQFEKWNGCVVKLARCAAVFGALIFALSGAAVRAQDTVVRYGDSKGVTRALLTAAGELTDIPYRVEWVEFPATAPALEALAAGAIDVRGSASAPLIFAVGAGAPIKVIASVHYEAASDSVAILVLPGSPLRTAADLKGKRIATNKGSVGHHLVLAVLRKQSIPQSDVAVQYLLPSDAKAALDGGFVDAWSTWDPYTSLSEIQDHLRPLATGAGNLEVDGDVVASVAAITTKRRQLRDFIVRMDRAEQWGRGHQEEYAQLLSRQTGLPLEAARLVARHRVGRYVPVGASAVREHQDVADLYLQAGVIRQRVDVATAFDASVMSGALGNP